MKSSFRLGLLLCVLISLLIACTHEEKATATIFIRALEGSSKNTKSNQELRISEINKDDWDRMFVFGPYTPIKVIETAIKASASKAIKQTKIDERDDINLFIFLKHDAVQTVVAVPRSIIDFTPHENNQAVGRESAIVKRSGTGQLFALEN